MVASTAAADAVRNYLIFVEDPDQLVDQERVQELQELIESEPDPLQRLIAVAEYERVRQPIESDFREAFIEHAKAWADEHKVTSEAFRQLGVPTEALEAAGIVQPATRTRTATPRRSVTTEVLKQVALAMTGDFTARELAEKAGGGSPMTIRKALAELVNEEVLANLGPAENWAHQGRAPIVYRPTRL